MSSTLMTRLRRNSYSHKCVLLRYIFGFYGLISNLSVSYKERKISKNSSSADNNNLSDLEFDLSKEMEN